MIRGGEPEGEGQDRDMRGSRVDEGITRDSNTYISAHIIMIIHIWLIKARF